MAGGGLTQQQAAQAQSLMSRYMGGPQNQYQSRFMNMQTGGNKLPLGMQSTPYQPSGVTLSQPQPSRPSWMNGTTVRQNPLTAHRQNRPQYQMRESLLGGQDQPSPQQQGDWRNFLR